MDYRIVPCTLKDRAMLCRVSYETYDDTFRPYNTPENMKAYLETAFEEGKMEAELLEPNSSFFFLMVGSDVAGYMKLNTSKAQTEMQDDEAMELERIYVVQAHHGKGLGRALLEKAISIARREHKAYLWLGVWEKNERALAFYKKHGFYRIGEHAFYMGDDCQTDYLLRKDLG